MRVSKLSLLAVLSGMPTIVAAQEAPATPTPTTTTPAPAPTPGAPTQSAPSSASVPPTQAPSTAPTEAAAQEAGETDEGDIVVTGQRPRGSVVGDIPPEQQLSPADIRSYGVGSVSELLSELAPQPTSGRGGAPDVLLNGLCILGF